MSLIPVMFAAVRLETPSAQIVVLLVVIITGAAAAVVRYRSAGGRADEVVGSVQAQRPDEQPADPRDRPMICVLGPIQTDGCDWRLTPQQLSLLTFLACGGTAGRDAIVDALWDGRAVSTGRFSNLLAETRSRIGRHHLPDAVNGRYRLVGVTTDLDRFESLLGDASVERSSDGSVDQALAIVRGLPFTSPSGRHWAWLDARPEQLHRAELVVTETLQDLAERYRAAGRPDRARQTLEAGLLAAPLDEDLTASLVDVLVELGMFTAARRLVSGWEQQMARLDGTKAASTMEDRLRASLR